MSSPVDRSGYLSSDEERYQRSGIKDKRNHVFYIVNEPLKPKAVKYSRRSKRLAGYNGYFVPRRSSGQWPTAESRPPPNPYQDYQEYSYENGLDEGSHLGAATQYNGLSSAIHSATTIHPVSVQHQAQCPQASLYSNVQRQINVQDAAVNQYISENQHAAENEDADKDPDADEYSKSSPSASTPPLQNDLANDSLLHIQVADYRNNLKNTIALLDTGCLYGNWVSTRKVRELKMEHKLERYFRAPVMLAVNGDKVPSRGSIRLDWKVTNVGTRMFTTSFFLVEADHLDIIFGAQFLFSKGVIQIVFNKSALAPFVPHSMPSPEEKKRIELALEKQRQEILEREKRRKVKEEARRQANNSYQTFPNRNRNDDDDD